MTGSREWMGLGKRPRTAAEVIKRLKQTGALSRRRTTGSYAQQWSRIAPPEVVRHTRVERFHKGTLTVICDSSALLAELSTFYRDELVSELRAAGTPEHVDRIAFRLGKVPKER